MNDTDFLTSPDFMILAGLVLAIAIIGGLIGGLFSTWIADREHRRAMRSRQPQYLERL